MTESNEVWCTTRSCPDDEIREEVTAVLSCRDRGRRGLPVALAVATLAVVPACAGGGIDAVPAAARQPVTAGPAVEATARAGSLPDPAPDWRRALEATATWSGTATYDLRARDGATARLTVTRSAADVRVDVTTGGLTSSVMTADAGWVACATGDRTSCLTVAPPGAMLPDVWDPGVGNLLTAVLPALHERDRGLYPDGHVAAGREPAAACVEVVAPDTGRYCVTGAGLLRRAKFSGGTLALVRSATDVPAGSFTPPVTPTPLG